MSKSYNLSLCMFEYPAAQYDIHHWISRFASKIISLNRLSEHVYDIVVDGENIVCFSNVIFRNEEERALLRAALCSKDYQLLQTTRQSFYITISPICSPGQ